MSVVLKIFSITRVKSLIIFQIVDILSKDPSLVPNKDMKVNKVRRNSKEIESPTVSRVTSTVDR